WRHAVAERDPSSRRRRIEQCSCRTRLESRAVSSYLNRFEPAGRTIEQLLAIAPPPRLGATASGDHPLSGAIAGSGECAHVDFWRAGLFRRIGNPARIG